MSGTQVIPVQRLDAVLEESINRQLQAVVTHRTPEGWRAHKSSLASGSSESDAVFLQARTPRDAEDLHLPRPGETLGVSFRLGHKKCMFSSELRSLQQRPESILFELRWPTQIQQLQRRAYERVAPPKGNVVAVRFWHEPADSGNEAEERTVRHGQLEDISAGGMRMKVADARDMEMGRTYRCVFTPRPGTPALILDATMCHREAGDQGRVSLGFQFIGLETSTQGRRMLDQLARVVSQFQQANRRRRS